jgi:hypothetical protein
VVGERRALPASDGRRTRRGWVLSPLRRSLTDPYETEKKTLWPASLYLDDLEILVDALDSASSRAHKEMDAQRIERLQALSDEEREIYERLNEKVRARAMEVRPDGNEDGPHVDGVRHADSCLQIRAGVARAIEVADLADARPEELRHVVLGARHPRVYIHLGQQYAYVSAIAGDKDAFALAEKVEKFVRGKRSVSAFFATTPRFLFMVPLLGLAWAVAFLFARPDRPYDAWSAAGSVTVALIVTLGFASYKASRMGGIVVHAVRRSEAHGLSSETRRVLVVAVAAALAGALATTVGAVLIARGG